MSVPVIHQEFAISTDYYGQEVYIEIQGMDFTNCASPKGGNFGDALITDSSTGRLEGQLVIVNTLGMSILTKPGTVNIDFVINQATSPTVTIQRDGVRAIQENGTGTNNYRKILVARIPMRIVAPGEATRVPISVDNNSTVAINNNGQTNTATSSSSENFVSTGVLPLSQTFSVDGAKYKNGVFCTSIDLYFYQKSTTNNGDVRLSIRTVANGLPTTNQLDSALSIVNSSNINVSTDPKNLSATKFRFPYPIYLEPGKEYAVTVTTPDANFLLYLAKVGEVVIPIISISPLGGSSIVGTNTVSNKQPGVGKLYKLSNAGAQVEETGASILFKVNKAIFETGRKSFVKQTVDITPVDFKYGSAVVNVNNKQFGNDTSITTEFESKELGGTTISYSSIPLNAEQIFTSRRIIKNEGDAKVRVTLENKDKNISPALDMSTLKLLTKKWEIDSINDVNDIRVTETFSTNGFAKSKYISKIVTLNPDFDSTGLEVKLNVNRKNNTDIDVFCRVKSSLDNSIGATIEKNSWKLMPLYSSANSVSTSGTNYSVVSPAKTSVGTSEAFVAETYRILENDSSNLSYSSNSSGVVTTFNNFNQFQVKIVMYGDLDNNRIPKVKNLIATAVI